jgi:hypothetical protein
MMLDKGWYLALKEAFKGLPDADRRAIELVWNYPGVPVFHLPGRIGRKPGGSVWLAIGDRIAKKRLWSRVPRHIRSLNERPGYLSPINPVGKGPERRSGCYLGRRQVASLDRRISTSTHFSQGSIMLRMVLLGLLIPLGVGVLAAMELGTPPRTIVTVVQPLAGTTVGISDSPGALAKTDRLEVTYAKSEIPTEPGPVDEPIVPSEAATIGSPEPPRIISRHWHDPKTSHRHDPKTKRVTSAASVKPKPRTPDIKRAAIPDRSRTGSDTESCRLSAFGGLRKALNLSGCEI